MGQRMQLIVILPAVYYNSDNPNNRGKKVVVYHNQWLYGHSFLRYIKRLMVALEFSRTENHVLTGWVEAGLDKAIGFANHSDLEYSTNTHPYEDAEHDYNKDLAEAGSVLKFLELWDNNNGYIFLELDEEGNARFDILNGYEDADTIKRRTAQQYLSLFYKPTEQTEEMRKTIKALSVYGRCDAFKELDRLREALKAEAKRC